MTDKLKAVVIDDEEKGRKLLLNLLTRYCPDVEVERLADSVPSGIKAVNETRPDIIFLDVVMPNQNGFELLNKIDTGQCDVIFTTAHDRYAIRAIRVCALDYLLKPIDFQELQEAVKRAAQKREASPPESDQRLKMFVANLSGQGLYPQKIGIPTASGVRFYPIDRIVSCKAEGNYTTVYLDKKEQLDLVCKTLKEFEELLYDYGFARTHRSYLINLRHLREYHRGESGSRGDGGTVLLSSGQRVPVSRDKRKSLLAQISQPF